MSMFGEIVVGVMIVLAIMAVFAVVLILLAGPLGELFQTAGAMLMLNSIGMLVLILAEQVVEVTLTTVAFGLFSLLGGFLIFLIGLIPGSQQQLQTQ